VPSATITTNKPVYVPSDTAVFQLGGFQPGETIDLHVLQINGGAERGNGYSPWSTVAGADGTATVHYTIPNDGDSRSLQVTAAGESSHSTAHATFDEASPPGSSASLSFVPEHVSPFVVTDRSDYHPGDVANITGGGFQPGETVQLKVTFSDTGLVDNNGKQDPWVATADATGNFQASFDVTQADFGRQLQVNAVGKTSGKTAQHLFTDAVVTGATTSTVNTVITGNTAVGAAGFTTVTNGTTPLSITFVTATANDNIKISGQLGVYNNSTTTYGDLYVRILVDGTVKAGPYGFTLTRETSTLFIANFPFENELNVGGVAGATHTVLVQATSSIANVIWDPGTAQTLRVIDYKTFAASDVQVVQQNATEANPPALGGAGTAVANGAFTLVPSLTTSITTTTIDTLRLEATLSVENHSTIFLNLQVEFTIDGVATPSQTFWVPPDTSPDIFRTFQFENDVTNVSAAAHTINVMAGTTSGANLLYYDGSTATVPGGGGTANFWQTLRVIDYKTVANTTPSGSSGWVTTVDINSPVASGTTLATSYTTVTGLSATFTLNGTSPVRLETTLNLYNQSSTSLGFPHVQFLIDNVTVVAGNSWNVNAVDATNATQDEEFTDEEFVSLGSGTHTVVVQAFENTSLNMHFEGATGSNQTLRVAAFQNMFTNTTTTVTSSVNASTFGQSVTFTATTSALASGFSTPTGTATFLDGATTLGTAGLVVGVATFTTSTLAPAGVHSVTVSYGGDSSSNPSTSAIFSQTVSKAVTTTAVATSGTPTVFGQAVTFTATVSVTAPGSQAAGNPTGTVTFFDNGVSIGTGTLSNTATDTATFTTSILSVASHTITAQYTTADANFNTSAASAAITQVVGKASTSTTVATSGTPSVFGQAVTFTATVSVTAPGSQAAGNPTGTVTFFDGGVSIGTGTLSNTATDTATFTTSILSVASHTITAQYTTADANFNTSAASATITQVVGKASTSTTVATSGTPSVFGQAVTFTATVSVTAPGSQAAGNPTGTVTFFDGGVSIGTGTLSNTATDTATFTTSILSVASHTITAQYTTADANFNTSAASAAITQVVGKASTSTTVATSGTPSVFGQAVTFTATVSVTAPGSQAAGNPTGTVTFFDGGVSIGTGTLSNTATDTATFTTSILSVASHTITAQYTTADANFNASAASAAITQVVGKASTSTTVATSGTPSVFGQAVTFTATVSVTAPGSQAAGNPTGTVTFFDGGVFIGTGTLSNTATDTATFTKSNFTIGNHTITAQYTTADANFNTSAASAAITQVVGKAATTTTVVSGTNPSVFGQSVTFTATVTVNSPGSQAAGNPTGTVTFVDSGVSIGTGTLSNTATDKATFTTSALSVATHTITAQYTSGDTNFTASGASTAISQTVNQSGSSTTVVTSVNPSVFGQNVTFTATVTASGSGAGTPGGTVTFTDGVTSIGGGTLSAGTASFSTAALSVGNHTITVSYSGDMNFNASTSTAITQTVNKSASSTTVVTSVNPSVFGQNVTFTATVSASGSGAGTPGGTVTFNDGVTSIGSGTLSAGTASFSTAALSVGNHTITVSYSGDTNFNASTSTAITQTVNKSASSTTVVTSVNPSVFGQSVTFTATVSASGSGAGTPGGTVTFTDSVTSIGGGTLSAGTASFSTAALSVGNHTITVSYSGDTNFNASTSTAITQTVSKSASSTTVVTSVNPSVFGQSVTFTATVSASGSGAGTPGGSVTFTDGVTSIGSGTLSGGTASFSTAALSVGNHTITVSYSGDTNFNAGTSSAITQTVNKGASSTSVTSSVNPTAFGQSTTFTATVSASSPAAGTPGGTITFLDGGTSIGAATLSGGSGSFSTSSLSIGNRTITVSYSGDTNFSGSTSSAITQTVVASASSTTVTSSLNPSVFGQLVTFSATVSASGSGSGTPTGTVTYLDGSSTLGTATLSGGTAAFSTAGLSVGTHTITVSYSGDTNFSGSTSPAITQTVSQSGSQTTVISSQNPSVFGQSVTFTANVSPATLGTASTWAGFGRDAQHSGLSTVSSQDLGGIRWTAPVDLNPQYSGSDLLIHYGTPMATLAGTIIFPVKTGATNGFRMEARHSSDGSVLWTQTSDYILPQHDWTPSFGATLTPQGRLYFAGAGGTVYYRDSVDQPTGSTGQLSFVGLANYLANKSAYDSTVFIDTPLTSDANGNIFYGFRVQGSSPLGAVSGLARIGANGTGSYVLANTAAGNDSNINLVTHNCAPAVSLDGSTVYFTVRGGTYTSVTAFYGYLVGVDSTTLAPKYHVFLLDPRNGNATKIHDDGTSSPLVGPDGTVFVGTFGNPYNGSRGFTLHFSADLSTQYTPAAFGWDDTDAIVPASMVPSYTGSSSYLLFTKYNNYVSAEVGSSGGDGANQIAILDPYASQVDTRNDGVANFMVMKEILKQTGPTPDTQFVNQGFPNAVREWCINTAAVDPFTKSVLEPSEDGHIYRWDLTTNKLTQTLALTGGIGEAYVPTIIAPDGTVYTINGATLYAAGNIFTPTGTVTFLDGATTLGTVPLSNGMASLSTSSLSVGNHTITVSYSGDSNYTGSTSAPLVQSVNQAASSTTVTSSLNPSVFGQSVTFTATVSAVAPGVGTPTGTVTFLDGAATLGTASLSSGSATFGTSSLSAGVHTITVSYSGDTNFTGSTSSAITQTVTQDSSSSTVTTSVDPSVFGQSVTFTATVTSTNGGPVTGTATFKDGAATLGVVSLSSGTASLSTAALTVGTHTITVSYSGDSNVTGSTSAAITQTVHKDAATTALTSSVNPSLFGQPVTFTAMVTANLPGAGTPTGSVTFLDSGISFGTGVLAGGKASLTTSNRSAGVHSISARYNGDGNFNSATSAVLLETVNVADTTTSVSSSINPSVFGQILYFTATVSPVAPSTRTVSSGTVTFLDGAATIGTASVGAGTAVLGTFALSAAVHSITASYSDGGVNYNASTSATLLQTVNQAATTTTVTSSVNPSNVGQSVTFTATVSVNDPGSNAAANPSGTVTFLDNGVSIGTGTLSTSRNLGTFSEFPVPSAGAFPQSIATGSDGNLWFTEPDNNIIGRITTGGAVTEFAIPTANSFAFKITAGPDGNLWFAENNTNMIGRITTAGVITEFAVPGDPYGITAGPDGNLWFTEENADKIGRITTSGTVTEFTGLQGVNPFEITAGPDGNLWFTEFSASNKIGRITTSGVITEFNVPTANAEPYAITAGPDGNLWFTEFNTNKIGRITPSGTFAEFSVPNASSQFLGITAGSDGYIWFTESLSNKIGRINPTTQTILEWGVPTAPPVGVTGADGITAGPDGNLWFTEAGQNQIGRITTSGVTTASFTTSNLSGGLHTITASYGGDANFAGSTSSALTQTVIVGNSNTTVTSSVNPSVFGQSVTFSATVTAVSPAIGTPTGTVTFLDAGVSIGSGTLSGGSANFTTSSLSVGTHTITVSYSGDVNFNSSTSSNLLQTVNQASSSTTVTSSPNPSATGQTVTFTATVSAVPPGAGTPTGTVTFLDGAATLGTAALSGGTATLSTAGLSAGTHSITVSYAGDTNFTGSTSAVLTQTVGASSTTTAVTSSLNPSVFGNTVTFTAVVTVPAPGSGTPTGTVTYLDGSSTLGTATLSSGSATLSTAALSAGTHTITVNYSGDSNFIASSSPAITETVTQAATTTTVSSSQNPSVFGQPVTFTADVNPSLLGTASTWNGFGRDGQHTGLSTISSQLLEGVRWTTPVDLNPQFSGGDLSIHYGTPMATLGGSIIFPVKTGASSGFEMQARRSADGSLIWNITSDYILPSHNWIPSFPSGMTPQGRVYFAGAGGTVYYRDSVDSGSGATGHIAFFGPLSTYLSNQSAYDSTVFIDTPITSDSHGNIYFGFRVQGTSPLSIGAQSGFARIDANGNGTYVGATNATGDSAITRDTHNDAPMLSLDESTVYVVSKDTNVYSYSYLLGLDSTTLATKYKVLLHDPRNNNANTTGPLDDGTASGTIGPDGTVFYGVFGNPDNGSRGFMLHFSADLATEFTPGAFGWDDTDAIVPASMVPSYTGSSSYLLFTKYNNYVSAETGANGGDGVNQIAILDPYAAQIDTRNDGVSNFMVMKEIMKANGPTPDANWINNGFPNAVREWCINTSAVDPFTDSILEPSEDGHLYRWDLTTGKFSQSVALTGGIGEPYVPTIIAPDGTVYTINGGILFAVGMPTPTGSVTFLDGSTTLGTVALNAGTANLTTASLAVGIHSITVVYSGDTNYSGSTSAVLLQTVSQASSSTTVTSSLNPSVFGQTVTFTETVSAVAPGAGTPTGTVSFVDGSTTLATVALNSGNATFSTSSLSAGTHTITVSYSGDTNFTGSTSSNLLQTVTQDSSSTTLTSSINPSVFGQTVTFTATVSNGHGGPMTGTVTFVDGAATLGTVSLSSGTAALATSALAVGSHTITATYSGDSNVTGSTSAPITQTVDQASSSTTLTSSLNPSASGQAVTFTATVSAVSPGAGTPGGTVTFSDGGVSIGSGTLSGGTASLTTSALTVGTHTITVSYSGDTNFTASSSAALTQTVVQATATTTVTSSANPSVFGQSVTFTATVTANAGSNTPTGTVTFLDSSSTLGTATLSGGTASLTTSALAVGTHTITVSYTGDSNFVGSTSAAITQTVNQDSTTTSVTSNVNASVFGQSVTFTATVSANTPGSGTPTGTVTFKDGGVSIGSGTLSGGTASLTTSSLTVGTHTITVAYSGDTNFTGSSSSNYLQTVNQDASTASVVSNPNPSTFGQTVTFTATVTAASPGSGTPTGTVTFKDGAVSIGSGSLSGGSATFSTASLSAGVHTITVAYSGDSNFTGASSAAYSQTVNQDSSSTSVTSSVNPSAVNQTVTFTATVSASAPGSGTPTGTVTFLDGGLSIGTGTLSGGTATFTTSFSTSGNHSITATYAGDANFTGSAGTMTQSVTIATSSTTVASSVNPSVFGQTVTFTATVTAGSGSNTPTGTVTFFDGGTSIGTGTLAGGGGSASANLTTSTLTLGNHTITVTYGGDSNFLSSASGPITQTVNKSGTSTIVSSSANPSVFGQGVTFTATVSPAGAGAGTPGGTVTFLDSAATLGTATLSGGTASITTSSLAVGSHTITVSYSGDSNFNASTSAAITQTVNKDSTTTTASSSANPSVFGQTVTFTATVTANPPGAGTATGTVTFLDGAATLGTAPLSGGTATLMTSAQAVGMHTITVSYGGDTNFSGSTSTAITQTVNPDGSTTTVTSSVNPTGFGQTATFTATVTAAAPGSGAPTGTVTFLDGGASIASGTLSGGSATFSTSTLSVGMHTITVSYSGDSNFNSSTSSAITQTVTKASTTTTLTSSANPSGAGQPVTFTAVVSPNSGSATPTGTVAFLDSGSTIGTGTLSSGTAMFTTSTLSIGVHTITARYAGDSNFNSSVSTALTQTINKNSSSTTLMSSLNPSVWSQSITFTVTVSGTGPTPTGSVVYLDGSITLATANLNAAGQAFFSTSFLSVGIHSITATYSGDANYFGSNSAILSQTVNQASANTVVNSSLDPSTFGQTITLSATVTAVSPATGTPTGSVAFMDGSSTIASVGLSGGMATFTTNVLSAGIRSITAVYSGDSHFGTNSSLAFLQTVNKGGTKTALSNSPNSTVFGQGITFTATVSVLAPASGTRTGNVAFTDSGTTIGTAAVNTNGQAALSLTTLSVGIHSITATYLGDANFISSASSPVTQTVSKAATNTTLASSANPAFINQSITFTATVTPVSPSSGAPSGTVSFLDGAATLGTASLNGANPDIATFTTSTLAVGTHTITATYGGDSNYNSSTSLTLVQTVNKFTSTTTVTSSLNPAFINQTVTFTATVSGSAGTPTGTVTFLDGSSTLTTASLSGGSATFSTSTLSVGTHTIKVTYGGDANYNTSTSAALSQTVSLIGTSTTLTSSLNPSVYAQSVTFTAVVASATGAIPTGTVTFMDGTTGFGTGNLDATGTATFSASGLLGGVHSITAVYNGSSNMATSTSPVLSQTVNAASSSSTLVSSINPSTFGQVVTFSITVTGTGSPPTGTATFYDGATSLATVNLGDPSNPATAGKASLSVPSTGVGALSAGTHSISAIYNGNPSYSPSTSNTVNQSVNKASTFSTLTSSPNPSNVGSSVTFTAGVTALAPGSGTATGTVTFLEGATTLATASLNGSGQAMFTTSMLPFGNHTITASYGGDANFNGSASAALTQTVATAATTTTLTSSVNPSTFAQSVTFTATVTSGVTGTPTGTVTFKDGPTTLGTGTLNGSAQATFATATLAGGLHTITATYGGDSNYSTSTSAGLSQTVNAASTSTALVSSVNPSGVGQSVTFTATVTSGAGTPAGSVRFLDGSTTLGLVALNGSGQASFSTSTLSGGTHSITAAYLGNGNFAASTSAAVTQTVSQSATTTTLTDSVQSSMSGSPFTLTATVNGGGAGTPTGTVTFLDGGTTTIGTGNLNGSGVATLTISTLSTGIHTLTASYGGDASFTGSTSAPITHTVTGAGSSTAVVSSLNPSSFGQSVTFAATVTPGGPGTPTGTVVFKDGGTSIGSGTLNASAQATFTTSSLSGGNHTITATYGGDVNFAGSTSPAITETVNKGSSTSTVSSSLNPSNVGSAVTFTATVTPVAPATATPTGTVTFLDGASTMGTAAVDGTGHATFTTSTLSGGNHTITVNYGGDANYTGSTSAAITQTVNGASSTTSLTSSLNPSVVGQAVVFTATVSPGSGSGTPTGTVTFLDGAATVGTASLSSGKATLSTTTLSAKNHTITASYGGDSNFAGSTSGPLTQTVNKASTSTAVVSSFNPSDSGSAVTFTATVTPVAPGGGVPSGTVTYFDGTTSLTNITLSGGKAAFTTSTLSIGTHSITVKYNGDSNYNSSTSPVLLQTVLNGGQIAHRPGASVIAPVGSGNTSTAVSVLQPSKQPGTFVAAVQPTARQSTTQSRTSLDTSVRDEFFTLVSKGEEKGLLGIRGVLKNVIDSVWKLF
jgi:hypothetical protein